MMEAGMGSMTHYVALSFMKSDDSSEIVACDPKEAMSTGRER
jgi:hypothetical protein